jgi:hypothetical protein
MNRFIRSSSALIVAVVTSLITLSGGAALAATETWRGRVEVAGMSISMQGTHQLVDETGNVVLLLSAARPSVRLAPFVGKWAVVVGDVQPAVTGSARHMNVERIQIGVRPVLARGNVEELLATLGRAGTFTIGDKYAWSVLSGVLGAGIGDDAADFDMKQEMLALTIFPATHRTSFINHDDLVLDPFYARFTINYYIARSAQGLLVSAMPRRGYGVRYRFAGTGYFGAPVITRATAIRLDHARQPAGQTTPAGTEPQENPTTGDLEWNDGGAVAGLHTLIAVPGVFPPPPPREKALGASKTVYYSFTGVYFVRELKVVGNHLELIWTGPFVPGKRP